MSIVGGGGLGKYVCAILRQVHAVIMHLGGILLRLLALVGGFLALFGERLGLPRIIGLEQGSFTKIGDGDLGSVFQPHLRIIIGVSRWLLRFGGLILVFGLSFVLVLIVSLGVDIFDIAVDVVVFGVGVDLFRRRQIPRRLTFPCRPRSGSGYRPLCLLRD